MIQRLRRPTADLPKLGVCLLLGLAPACQSKPAKEDTKPAEGAEKAEKSETDDPDGETPEDKEATFAQPNPTPPKAPEGSITIADPWLYVQTCAESHPCPDLKQPAGDAHCRELKLGGQEGWRLPSKDEVPRFKGAEGLEQLAGYHWTRTPFEDDMGQVWIVDPEDPQAAPSTTIPRDRKPFRVRCVKEP